MDNIYNNSKVNDFIDVMNKSLYKIICMIVYIIIYSNYILKY